MKVRRGMSLLPVLSSDVLVVLVFLLGATFLTAGLIPISELTRSLIESSSALKTVTEQQRNLISVTTSLHIMRERLNNRGDIQDYADQLRNASSRLDAELHTLSAPRPASWFALTADTGATKAPIAGVHVEQLRQLGAQLHASLMPLFRPLASIYSNDPATGRVLSDSGQQLERDVAEAINVDDADVPQLDATLAEIGAELQTANAQSASQLQTMMLAGLLIGGALVALVVLLMSARWIQDASLREARQQTTDIMRTVKDGLFLLDRDLVIGSTYSAALETLFQRRDIAGLGFESLLQKIVSEKTLAIALKFVKVLWLERTNEKLVRSINPLGEVEVHLDAGEGKFDTRYLQFEFHRVRVEGKITQILVDVSDVSSRVELARELQASQGKAQAQLDTLLGILHIDPAQLRSFLSDSHAAMKMINAVLREPAREESAFRGKLNTLFRQAHAVKGEAAALGLSSIESRAHSFEDDLKALREKPDLSGNDFLPLVIKLDDLMTHLQSVNDVVARLSTLGAAASDTLFARVADRGSHGDTIEESLGPVIEKPPAAADGGLAATLQQLAVRIAAENDKSATLQCLGFETVPEDYRRMVKDIAIQAVRNAIVHGIEPASVRLAAGKPTHGVVRLSFSSVGESGYKLSIEDDGQGLVLERIKQVALQKGFITAQQAVNLNPKQMYSLLFRPGFSTAATATKDAGRGVGMNVMADLMQQIGGRVGIATQEGKFTRLVLTLPPHGKAAGKTAAA